MDIFRVRRLDLAATETTSIPRIYDEEISLHYLHKVESLNCPRHQQCGQPREPGRQRKHDPVETRLKRAKDNLSSDNLRTIDRVSHLFGDWEYAFIIMSSTCTHVQFSDSLYAQHQNKRVDVRWATSSNRSEVIL